MDSVPSNANERKFFRCDDADLGVDFKWVPWKSVWHKPNNSFIATDCPGTKSEDAGKVSSCEGCPNQQVCASGVARQPDPGKPCLLW